jgi:hypothetical protein
MHGTIAAGDKPVEIKHRTITLTNRAPIKIVEGDWPIIAQGIVGQDWGEFGWECAFRIRRCQKENGHWPAGDYIIHANYHFNSPGEQDSQRVRVGRYIPAHDAAGNLWKRISEVGEELKSRIMADKHRQCATFAIDECFANLPAQSA